MFRYLQAWPSHVCVFGWYMYSDVPIHGGQGTAPSVVPQVPAILVYWDSLFLIASKLTSRLRWLVRNPHHPIIRVRDTCQHSLSFSLGSQEQVRASMFVWQAPYGLGSLSSLWHSLAIRGRSVSTIPGTRHLGLGSRLCLLGISIKWTGTMVSILQEWIIFKTWKSYLTLFKPRIFMC